MIEVYYAVKPTWSKVDNIFDSTMTLTMLDEGLSSVYKDLKQNQNKDIENMGSMFSCRSFLQYTKNMYVMKNPFDINVRVEKSKVFNLGNRELDKLFMNRVLQIENVYNFNYTPGYLFFSEESVEIEILSPFMHKSNFCKNGYIVPGSYDISKWFRPVNPALQFYDNSEKIIVSEKNDPLMYINFRTHDNIKLKKFMVTPEIEDIIHAATTYKRYDPNRSLSYIYDKFVKGGFHKRTLRLIKENLI
jgi:hypothetical protein